jgi:hypothetical protein
MHFVYKRTGHFGYESNGRRVAHPSFGKGGDGCCCWPGSQRQDALLLQLAHEAAKSAATAIATATGEAVAGVAAEELGRAGRPEKGFVCLWVKQQR